MRLPDSPRAWPYGSREDWEAYKAELERCGHPGAPFWLEEAQHEIARIERCESEAVQPKTRSVVPAFDERHADLAASRLSKSMTPGALKAAARARAVAAQRAAEARQRAIYRWQNDQGATKSASKSA